MYAVIRTGGKQYTVKPGDVLQVEKLEKDLGAEFDINEVLLLGGETTSIGLPLVKNAKVTVVVTKQAKTRKLTVFKKKRRTSYRKMKTHRQDFTELFVKSITSPDGKVEKTDATPNVVDMAAKRLETIKAKQETARERRENKTPSETLQAEVKKTVAKKKVAKKSAAKKTGKAKSVKKAGAKKAAKKTKKKS